MTRFARAGKRSFLPASDWKELKKGGGGQSSSGKAELSYDERKEKRREQRRLRRQRKVCFQCRKLGHSIAECPEVSGAGGASGLCYRCGSTEHSSKQCKAPVDSSKGEFAFAKCFICGETGHLSRQCPDNPRGLYPMGGSCHFCGSVEHLKSNCPENTSKQNTLSDRRGTVTTLKRRKLTESADAEYVEESSAPQKKKRKSEKVVKF